MHSVTETLVPHEILEKQPSGINRPRIGQGRAGVKRKVRPVSNETPKPVETIPMTHPITQLQGATTTWKTNTTYQSRCQTANRTKT